MNRYPLQPFFMVLALTSLTDIVNAEVISITVLTAEGAPLQDAVAYLEPNNGTLINTESRVATMDQHNKTFVPHVLAVTVGTTVEFPNTDSVNHYVYSFSDIKKFQLKLFKRDIEKSKILFDRPGLITIGCNIHDFMLGYIFIAPTPYVGTTNEAGSLQLTLPAKGDFTLKVWHERINENSENLNQLITMNLANQSATIHFKNPLKPERKMNHDADNY